MGPRPDTAPPEHSLGEERPAGWRRWRPSQTTAWLLAVVTPVVAFVVTQLDVVQDAEGWFVRGLIWDIGKKAIVADILAPIWVVSIVVVAALERRMLRYYAEVSLPPPSTPIPVLTSRRVHASTWVATAGAVGIVIMSWTREWVRFGEQPDAFWYVVTILIVLVLLAVPVWWVRHDLFHDIHDAVAGSRSANAVGRYLFADDDRSGPRWVVLLAFAGLTAVITFTVLAQLDALLKGMHTTGGVSAGMNGLASVFELDLSQKPAQIIERVGSWAAYAADVGPGYASGHAVATIYLALDSFVMVPAYGTVLLILLLRARRTRPEHLSEPASESYSIVNGAGFLALTVLVGADIVENLMTWIVVDSAWFTPDTLSNWTVRLMWFASMFRTLALWGLVAVAILTVAFRASRYRSLGDAIVAVRGQILVLVLLTALLTMGQISDVVRRWTVSVAFITTILATALAVFLHWTSTAAFERLRRQRAAVDAGEAPEPVRVRVPWSSRAVPLRRLVVVAILLGAAVQVVLVGALGLPVGLGLTVPAGVIAIIWVFGLPLPPSRYRRGDRNIERAVRRWFPRILGSAVFVVLGLVVVRAAIAQLVFARHGDAWLWFCLVPVAIGIYRIHTRSWSTMGALELFVIGMVSAVGVSLWVTQGDPEVSPVALAFVGLLIAFGSMPFYYSYEGASLPSRLARERLPWLRVEPLIVVGGGIAAATALAVVVVPLDVPERIGTVAVVVLGAMVLAGFAAAAVAYAESTTPPRIVAAFGLNRMPVFVFMLVWLSLAGIAATAASNDVAVQERSGGTAAGTVTIDDVWARWFERNASGAGDGEVVPLVFIASSGGGIRAAAWTSYVMDCLFGGNLTIDGCTDEPRGGERIAVMSGVSGGSLGLAAWGASATNPEVASGEGDWVLDRLGDDYLAGAMAWLLLVDTPRSFVGFGPTIRGRAEIMELAWEASWSGSGENLLGMGMYELWDTHPDLPLMIFNGTSVNDPCRFNGSVLSATAHPEGDTCTSLSVFENRSDPADDHVTLAATQDLADYLCPDQDIKVSTAALMSARFPVIAPSARVGGQAGDCVDDPAVAYVVDGGYLEGSGASTITELWRRLEPDVEAYNEASDACIVPFLIQIDNGYENPRAAPAGTSPIEVLIPIRSLLSSQFGRIANAREQAAISFDQPFDIGGRSIVVADADGAPIESRYARITTRAHPGIQAPLGWTLSRESFNDLRSQLTIRENLAEIAEVRRWLTDGVTCAEVGAAG